MHANVHLDKFQYHSSHDMCFDFIVEVIALTSFTLRIREGRV